ncbi:MAG: DNA adenine methylase [Ktedonobacteraceae bacterium]
MTAIVPPIKCQGIKTKIVPIINGSVPQSVQGRWIEPFCGSCVVALNVKPERALLTDTNTHIIALYKRIQEGIITPEIVRSFLVREGEKLSELGEKHYYEVRHRFNETHDSLDFLFLNRACFNGVMRFNQKGKFNVPFCRKPDRFRPAYITKIVNQIKNFKRVLHGRDWQFEVLDFRQTLARAGVDDFIYADPPYAGRHVDYFNSWDTRDEQDMIRLLKRLPCKFLLSTWHSNTFRENQSVQDHWQENTFFIRTAKHFYHVGPTEELRNAMMEALISNYHMPEMDDVPMQQPLLPLQQMLFI